MGLKRAKHTLTGPFCKRSSCFHANAFARAPGTERSLPQLLRAADRGPLYRRRRSFGPGLERQMRRNKNAGVAEKRRWSGTLGPPVTDAPAWGRTVHAGRRSRLLHPCLGSPICTGQCL